MLGTGKQYVMAGSAPTTLSYARVSRGLGQGPARAKPAGVFSHSRGVGGSHDRAAAGPVILASADLADEKEGLTGLRCTSVDEPIVGVELADVQGRILPGYTTRLVADRPHHWLGFSQAISLISPAA